jgi:hypothetical protein
MYRSLYFLCNLALPVLGLAYAQCVPMKRAMLLSTWCPTSKSHHRPQVRPWLSSESTVKQAARRKGICGLRCCNRAASKTIVQSYVEIWQDQKAHTAHVMAGHTKQFRERFQLLSGSL